MDEAEANVAIFKACASTILGMNLTPNEARAGAAALRAGDIGHRLAMLLDGLVPTPFNNKSDTHGQPAAPKKSFSTGKSVRISAESQARDTPANQLFEDVKRRKITKAQLFELFRQVSPPDSHIIDSDLSMREALVQFKKGSTPDDWNFLVDIIRMGANLDPFLNKMTTR
ncbi:hypothetical protein U1763_13205 [Sphingomonas sp. LB2R24]|uniref:hypothetical protein n=1 Tax=Sphingomonas sorbitolis TaxID=3096165 RepID=UPI002FCC22D2